MSKKILAIVLLILFLLPLVIAEEYESVKIGETVQFNVINGTTGAGLNSIDCDVSIYYSNNTLFLSDYPVSENTQEDGLYYLAINSSFQESFQYLGYINCSVGGQQGVQGVPFEIFEETRSWSLSSIWEKVTDVFNNIGSSGGTGGIPISAINFDSPEFESFMERIVRRGVRAELSDFLNNNPTVLPTLGFTASGLFVLAARRERTKREKLKNPPF